MAGLYGSERHLLRYLGYHRAELSRRVQETLGADDTRWLDFAFHPSAGDRELKGLEFLDPAEASAQHEWARWWPQTGNVPNWDAVAKVRFEGGWEWLLLEAKAHPGEMKSDCRASEKGGRPEIRAALSAARGWLEVEEPTGDWLRTYYQHANRLATVAFLTREGVPTRLMNLYFTGDSRPGIVSPQAPAEWEPALATMEAYLGIAASEAVRRVSSRLFLPVNG